MQISLNQNEIEAGIKMYIESRGISLSDRPVSVDFTATRKNNSGINAEVDLGEDASFSPAEMLPSFGIIMTSKPGGGVTARRNPPVELQDPKQDQTEGPDIAPPEEAANDATEEELTESEEQEATAPKQKRTRKAKAETKAEPVEEEETPVVEELAVEQQLATEATHVAETPSATNLFATPTPSAEKPVAEPVSPGIPAAEPEIRQSLFG